MEERLAAVQAENPMKKFYLHDGYHGWSYGTPQDPMLISNDDGLFLLTWAAKDFEGDVFDAAQATLPPVELAKDDDPRRTALGGNRFLFLGASAECIIQKRDLIETEHQINREPFQH
jgi:hypothetical protein